MLFFRFVLGPIRTQLMGCPQSVRGRMGDLFDRPEPGTVMEGA